MIQWFLCRSRIGSEAFGWLQDIDYIRCFVCKDCLFISVLCKYCIRRLFYGPPLPNERYSKFWDIYSASIRMFLIFLGCYLVISCIHNALHNFALSSVTLQIHTS